MTKENILSLVSAYIEARPGFDWRNYHGAPASCYRADYATARRGLHDGRALLRACALSGVTAATLAAALTEARRLTLTADGRLEHTACQYPPTEYRAAACRALADALYRHYLADGDRTRTLRTLRNVLGSRLVARWLA